MTHPLLFRDWVEFHDVKFRPDAVQFFEDVSKEAGAKLSLLVDSPATWSGYLLNGRVYPGAHMKEGVRTWCDPEHGGIDHFNKPVLVHHNSDSGDPIGRVVNASYEQLLFGDQFFQDWEQPARQGASGSGRIDLRMRITHPEAIDKFLRGEYGTFSTSFDSSHAICTVCGKNMKAEGWCGHVPGKVYEAKDANEEVVKAECYFVTGPMFYKEVSVVNDPAQPRAIVQNMQLEEALKDGTEFPAFFDRGLGAAPTMLLQDSASGTATRLTMNDGESGAIPSGTGNIRRRLQISIPDPQPLTAGDPVLKQDAGTGKDPEPLAGDEDFALAHIAHRLIEQGLLKTDDEVSINDVAIVGGEAVVYVSGLTELKKEDHTHTLYLQIDMKAKVLRGWTEGTYSLKEKVEVDSHHHSIEIPIKDLNKDVFEGETRDADYGERHTHQVRVVMNRDAVGLGPSYTDLLESISAHRDDFSSDRYWDEFFADKKLSAKERKKLKSSTFCGPDRSFPVPDCAHVTAARRLVGRYKGSADSKKRILDSVASRAKELGCGGSDAGQIATERSRMTKNGDPSGAGGAPASTDKSIEDLQKQNSELDSRVNTQGTQIEDLLTDKKDLQASRDQKDQELKDMTEKHTAGQAEIQRLTALNLATMRVVSGHADAKGLDTFDKVSEYATKLQERQLQSIQDAIKDESVAFVDRIAAFGSAGGVAPKITDATTPDGRAQIQVHKDAGDKPPTTPTKKNPLDQM